jgi:hypothetical protein
MGPRRRAYPASPLQYRRKRNEESAPWDLEKRATGLEPATLSLEG